MSDADGSGVRPDRHLASHLFNLAVLAAGTIGLAVMLDRLGWQSTRAVLAGVRGWFALILALDLAGLALDAAAIHQFMRPEARMVSYWRVLAAQASGRAINIFVPGGVVGEATKVAMLVTHAPKYRVVSSIVLFNLATFYISVAIVIVGVPITALTVDLPHHLAVVVWTALAVLIALVVGLAAIVRRGAIDSVAAALRGLHLISAARLDAWRVRIASLDAHLQELHTPGLRGALVLLGISRLVAWCATASVLAAVGVAIHASLLVGVLSVGVLISWAAAAVPLGIGVSDASYYALFDVLGASGAHGLFVTLLGRVRSLAVALVGLCVMGIAHALNRVGVARRNRRLGMLR